MTSTQPPPPSPVAAPDNRAGLARRAVRKVLNVLLYVALRVCGIDCSFGEVENGAYSHRGPMWPPLDPQELTETSYPLIDEYVSSLEGETKTRYDRLDSKLRSLLAMNAVAFGLMGGFSLLAKPIFMLIAVPLVVSAVLALRALGIHRLQTVSLTNDEIKVSVAVLKATMVRDRLASLNANALVIDFIVDCLRGAHRAFVFALVSVPIAYVINVYFPTQSPEVRVRVDSVAAEAMSGLRGLQAPPNVPSAVSPPGSAAPLGLRGSTEPRDAASISTE